MAAARAVPRAYAAARTGGPGSFRSMRFSTIHSWSVLLPAWQRCGVCTQQRGVVVQTWRAKAVYSDVKQNRAAMGMAVPACLASYGAAAARGAAREYVVLARKRSPLKQTHTLH